MKIIFWAGAAYFAFYFIHSLVTGTAPLFRNKPILRKESPNIYWAVTFGLALMTALFVWLGMLQISN